MGSNKVRIKHIEEDENFPAYPQTPVIVFIVIMLMIIGMIILQGASL